MNRALAEMPSDMLSNLKCLVMMWKKCSASFWNDSTKIQLKFETKAIYKIFHRFSINSMCQNNTTHFFFFNIKLFIKSVGLNLTMDMSNEITLIQLLYLICIFGLDFFLFFFQLFHWQQRDQFRRNENMSFIMRDTSSKNWPKLKPSIELASPAVSVFVSS